MLESIRSSAQSFGVKVAFGVIILVFVFWGVGNFNDRDYSNVVAVVNGQPIVAMEFEKAYLDAEEYLMRNNPGLTREQLARDHLGRQVLRELIQQTLLDQEARRAGIRVSPLEMRAAVADIKAFQDENGKFDPDAYKRVLAARRMSVSDYENGLARQLLRDKLFSLATAGVWVDPDEARHRFEFLRERRVADYIFIPASSFRGQVKVSSGDIQKWYDDHKSEYAIPPMVDVEYISLRPAALADKSKITEDAARAWYENNKSRYDRPEQVHASHILVPLPPDADEAAVKEAEAAIDKAKTEISQGRSFAEVADSINPAGVAGSGGDLDWIKRGETVPEFEEFVFSAPQGKVVGPVRTPFGLHLALVSEKREAGVVPFEEVEKEAREALAAEAGSEKLHDVLDSLIEDNILMKPLPEAAARYGLAAEKTGMLDRAGLMKKLGLKDDAVDALLAAQEGAPLDTALEAGDSYVIARIIKTSPAGVKPLAEVESGVKSALVAEKSQEMAMKDAAAVLERIKNEAPAKVREEKLDVRTSEPLERAGGFPGFLPNDPLMRAIFDAPLHSWVPEPQAVIESDGASGAMLVYIESQLPPDEKEFSGVADILQNAARQQRMEDVFGIFMENLAKKAKVEITNQNLIDRVGQ